jgi:hypothetical protein
MRSILGVSQLIGARILEVAIDAIGRSGDQVGVRLRAPAGERKIDGAACSSGSDEHRIRMPSSDMRALESNLTCAAASR